MGERRGVGVLLKDRCWHGLLRALERQVDETLGDAKISLAALNRNVQALLTSRSGRSAGRSSRGFKTYVSALPEVLSVFVVAGGDDLLVHVAVPSVDSLHAFLMDKFSKRREIVDFRSSVTYQHARNQVIAPLGP